MFYDFWDLNSCPPPCDPSHPSCFRLGAIIINTVMDVHMLVFVWTSFSLAVELLGHKIFLFNSFGNCQAFPEHSTILLTYQQSIKVLVSI